MRVHTLGAHDIVQLDDVLGIGLLAEKRKQFDLPDGGDREALLFVFHADAFEGKVLGGIAPGARQIHLCQWCGW